MQIANADGDGDGDASCILKMEQMTTRTQGLKHTLPLHYTHSHILTPQAHKKQ